MPSKGRYGTMIVRLALGFLWFLSVMVQPACGTEMFEELQLQQRIHGFRAVNLYSNAEGVAMGARFVSEPYGFIVDLFRIQSVPQALFWVKTLPLSDKGEPHTCEHLLLGKGNRGRAVAALETMSLTSSSAGTGQVRTFYHFHTVAGTKTFYQVLEAKLMAFLHPDFTDEEIKREVCHVAASVDPQSGNLFLEEKGSVYTEMVSTFEKPGYYPYNAMRELVYGTDHPLANVAGGEPSAIRTMTPDDLRVFHKDTHHLANMGMITAIPDEIALHDFLAELSAILGRCQDQPTSSSYFGLSDYPLPEPESAQIGTRKIVPYPSDTEQDPGIINICWPAQLSLDTRDRFLLDLFVETFASGSTSTLYDLFVNSSTRMIEPGAKEVWGWAPLYQGNPIWFGLEGLTPFQISGKVLEDVSRAICAELALIRNWEDHGNDLRAFNRIAASHLLQKRKNLEKLLNTPPLFGFRGGPASRWANHMELLEQETDFRKSFTRDAHFAAVERLLATGENLWAPLIDRCKLLAVEPYAVGAYAEPKLLEDMRRAKVKRLQTYEEELRRRFGVETDQEALAMFSEEFDLNSASLESTASATKLPGFVEDPPLTLDDHLVYQTISLPGGVPLVASTFPSMKSATLGVAFDLRVVPESLLVYVPLLPAVLTSIGVIENDNPVTYKTMEERLRNELLRYHASFDHGHQTGRIELLLSGSGSNIDELHNLIRWMNSSLFSPYLKTENLVRLTDLIDQRLVSLRETTKHAEEAWVRIPASAYRYQTDPLFLSTSMFFTKAHHLHRLRFRFAEPGDERQQRERIAFLQDLCEQGKSKSRSELLDLLQSINPNGTDEDRTAADSTPASTEGVVPEDPFVNVITEALRWCLLEVPEANLAEDWGYLCRQIQADLLVPPEKAIAELRQVLGMLLRSDTSRLFLISNEESRSASRSAIEAFVARFAPGRPTERQRYSDTPRILHRARSRNPGLTEPLFVGLLHDETRNGTIMFSSEYADEYDPSDDSVFDCLAGRLFSGGGAHSLFMRTWAAGLAYSNGISVNERTGRVSYYAERCPDVAETMRFVVGELQSPKQDPHLANYAVAQVFSGSRAASRYESRGIGIAADLADGYSPDRVSAFRTAVLRVASHENLYERVGSRISHVYGKALAGYGPPLQQSVNPLFFLIGPEVQFQSMENYITSTEGYHTILRLFPRDFWLTD
jgi:Zn-dependent M16 (insulinase) family peptidase